MASLMDELLATMSSEQEGYQKLIDISDSKKNAIIHGRVDELTDINAVEQSIADELKELEKKRLRVLKDMAVVTGHDNEEVTISSMINMLDKQPVEQRKLIEAKDSLRKTADHMQFLNQQNQILLQNAMEMVEFDLTLIKGLKQAPETANYNKNAYSTGDLLGNSGFDAKQ